MVSWAWLTEWIGLWKVRVANQSSGLALRSGASDRRDVFPRLLSLAARDLPDVGPAKSLQGARNLDGNFSCISLGGHQTLCRFFDRMHKKPFSSFQPTISIFHSLFYLSLVLNCSARLCTYYSSIIPLD